jgi:phage/plasmid-associated DNA primase
VRYGGDGTNGKGLFINTMTRILAEYAKTAPMETLWPHRAIGIRPNSPD